MIGALTCRVPMGDTVTEPLGTVCALRVGPDHAVTFPHALQMVSGVLQRMPVRAIEVGQVPTAPFARHQALHQALECLTRGCAFPARRQSTCL